MKRKAILSDENIVELYWARDERAIDETDAKYGRYLYAVAFNIVGDKSDCDECLNDTYLGAWNSMPPERPRALKAYLTVIMRRTATDVYKSGTRKKRVPVSITSSIEEIGELIPSASDVDEELAAKDLAAVIDGFVRSLNERQMYIFMSRYYLSRPIGEIARTLLCSISTVNKELAAIRAALKEKLESEGFSV